MASKALFGLTTALVLTLAPGLAWAGREKLDAPLRVQAGTRGARSKVIVQLAVPPGFSRRPYSWVPGDADTMRSLRARVAGLKGQVTGEFHSIRGFAAELPSEALDALSNEARIARISQNWGMKGHMDMVNEGLRADVARQTYGVDGSGIGVAVIDSGIHPHADFSRADGTGSRIIAWYDLVNGQAAPYDDHGHGTHVAGIVGGNGRSSTGGTYTKCFRGVAPNCNLIGVKALDQNNSAPTSRIITAVQWCIDNRAAYNIRVINLSMGHAIGESSSTDPLCAVVKLAHQAGIAVVVSAGNRGYNGYASVGVPGNCPEAITVGAIKHMGYKTRSYHRLAGFSSRGPTLVDHCLKPDVVSMGNRIVSLRVPGSTLDNIFTFNRVSPTSYGGASGETSTYFVLSGTSMATPTVAGAACLMIQKEPACTPATVKARLMKTSEKVTYVDIYGRGCGYLDVADALACTDVATSALSPQCVRNADGTVTVNGQIVATDSSIWSILICLGVNFAWGENNVGGESVVWTSEGLTEESPAAGESDVSGLGED